MAAPVTIPRARGPLFCGAKRRREDSTCRRPSGWGTDHAGWGRCKLHGGATENHVESVRHQQAQATAQLFGVPREQDPITGMLETYHQTLGILDAVEAMCLQLLPAEVTWGVVREKRVGSGEAGSEQGEGESLTPPEREYAAGVNIWVKLLAEWHDRAFKEAEAMLRLGLDQRKVEIASSQVAALVAVLLSPELALSEDQRRAAARILRTMDQQAIEGGVA